MKIKICTKYKKKLFATKEFFYVDKSKKSGLCSICKKCCGKSYRERRDGILLYKKGYRKDNSGYMKQWYEDNPDYNKKYYKKNKDAVLKKQKDYRKTSKCKKLNRKKSRKYYNENKLSCCISSMIYQVLKSNKKGLHWETLVPYTLKQLRQHLESLFQPGMSWGNHCMHGWHIDHKIPISNFKFTSFEDKEFQECWALENLQPLWAEDNLRKNNKLFVEKGLTNES